MNAVFNKEKNMNDAEEKNEEVEFVADDEATNIDTRGRITKLREELKTCSEEKKEYLDGWQRAKADHINYKKDEAKRLEDIARFVTAGLASDILPALDSFDLALGHGMNSEVEKGVLLIRSQLLDILKKRGLEVLTTAGKKFDPAFHEAIGEVEADGEEGMVAEEIQKGYMFRGAVVRPARVRISRKPVA
ncbi:MAG: nucleotide exchange factor GrpE [Candidatus Sungbacteria bacterium RIFCSPLOWO2_02_FULL_47_9]|nr:MAG: nucleotide exchange factor GrpE [Candidatus Sungbacteria bacterium RIFCSPLOWO2_02_FULL_47_9]